MSRKIFPLLFIIILIVSQTGCLYGNIVDNKYTTTGVGNLTPVKSLTYYVGSPTYTWAGGYFANLTSNYYNVYNTNTNISRDGAGNMIFTDAVSGTHTLADLTVGSGGNVIGGGTLGRITQWTSASTIGDATNTDAQVSAAVTASHAQNTDTALGVLGADLNMGGNSITNVNLVDGIDVSTLGTGNVTGGGAPTRLAYWDGATSLGDTNIYFDVPLGYYGIGTVTPATMLQIHDGSGANQLQLSYTAGSIYTNITSNHLGYLLLNPTGDRAVLSGNLSMDTHYINNVIDPSVAQDAATKNYVDTAVAGVGGGNVTNPLSDDVQFGIGNNYTSSLLWETADANANALVLALPDGGATDVPVLVIGDQSVINKDLTFFAATTQPQLVFMKNDETAYSGINYNSLFGTGTFNIYPNSDYTHYIRFSSGAVPSILGMGAYLRIGDAGTTSHSLASEDDLMVSGKLEVDGIADFDGGAEIYQYLNFGDAAYMAPFNIDNRYVLFKGRDNGVGLVELARWQSAADPYFQIGRDDTGVATGAVTDMLVLQAGVGTGNATANFGLGISAKLDNAASEVEERASIDFVLTDATNGAEASAIDVNLMTAGAMGKIVTISPTGMSFTPAGYTVDGVDISAISAVSNPMPDDSPFSFGTGNTSSLLWETADANANALVLALPDGGATDVPVIVIGDQGIINKDLGFFNGITYPMIAVLDADEDSWFGLNFLVDDIAFLRSNRPIQITSDTYIIFKGGNSSTYYVKQDIAGNVPSLYGGGAYLRIGDAGTTSHTLASEDDLMVSGILEVDGKAYFDSQVEIYASLYMGSSGSALSSRNADDGYLKIQSRDNTVGAVETMRLVGAADPYIQIGRDDTGVATNAVTDMLVLQAGAGTNNEAANFGLGTSWKIGNAASEVEERGSVDLVLTTATNGAEASKFNFSVMDAGAMVNPSLSITANTTATTLTAPSDMWVNTGANKTLVLLQPVWDDMMINLSTARGPTSGYPTWTAYKGSEVPAFSKTTTNTLYFSAQVPHSYKEDSDLEFHLHLTYPDNGVGVSNWKFTYSWANMAGTFPAETTVYANITSPASTDYHQFALITQAITGTGKDVSSVLVCSISRVGGDGADTYDNVIYAASADFHYLKDTIGSRFEATK